MRSPTKSRPLKRAPRPVIRNSVHDCMRDQLEYLIELAEAGALLGDNSAAERYSLAREALIESIFPDESHLLHLVRRLSA